MIANSLSDTSNLFSDLTTELTSQGFTEQQILPLITGLDASVAIFMETENFNQNMLDFIEDYEMVDFSGSGDNDLDLMMNEKESLGPSLDMPSFFEMNPENPIGSILSTLNFTEIYFKAASYFENDAALKLAYNDMFFGMEEALEKSMSLGYTLEEAWQNMVQKNSQFLRDSGVDATEVALIETKYEFLITEAEADPDQFFEFQIAIDNFHFSPWQL